MSKTETLTLHRYIAQWITFINKNLNCASSGNNETRFTRLDLFQPLGKILKIKEK